MATSITLLADIYVGGTLRAATTVLTTANIPYAEMARLVENGQATWLEVSRDAVLADLNTVIKTSSASAVVITIQNDATTRWPVAGATPKDSIALYQGGAGAASFAAGSGVTIRGTAPTAAQYSTQGVMRVGANEWAYL